MIELDKLEKKYVRVKNVYKIREMQEGYEGLNYSNPSKIARLFIAAYQHLDETREHFLSASLDTKNHLISLDVISIGSLNCNIVHPREVFYSAIANKANSIIVSHNHPSGSTAPSQNDIDITRKLVKTGEIVGIDVLDHIIVGIPEKFLSMKEENLMED